MTTFTSSFPHLLSTFPNSSYLPFSTSGHPTQAVSPFPLPGSLLPSATSASPNRTACSFECGPLRVTLVALYSLFFVLGLVGNLLALWVFLVLPGRRNSVRVLLINCAMADLVLLACLPFRVQYHLLGNRWVLGTLACKLVGHLFYMNMYISIILLGMVSLDRYLRFSRPKGARRGMLGRLCGRSHGGTWAVCCTLWGLSLATLVAMVTMREGNEEDGKCFQYKQRLGARGRAYFNGVLVLLFWAVFAMLGVSYGKIAVRLLAVSRDKPDLPNAQRYGRTARKSFFVLFLFTVCFGPYHAFRPVYILSQLSSALTCDYMRLMDHTNELMLLFSAFNSCLDPVMYFLLSGSVRKSALRLLGNSLGNRLHLLNEATSNSSTIPEACRVPQPHPALSHDSSTPRTCLSLTNTLCLTTNISQKMV